MAKVNLDAALRQEYRQLFDDCRSNPDKVKLVDTFIDRIAARRADYEEVAGQMNMPWQVVGAIHLMEASLNFTRHLHNGDPLSARTVQVPAGRPLGDPPFTWPQSATDALQMRGLQRWTDWSVPGTLYQLEGFNGFGYRRLAEPIATPYLWSFSNHYSAGKFVADGKYSPTAVSQQCGAAVLLKRMAERAVIELPPAEAPVQFAMPAAASKPGTRRTAKKKSRAKPAARTPKRKTAKRAAPQAKRSVKKKSARKK